MHFDNITSLAWVVIAVCLLISAVHEPTTATPLVSGIGCDMFAECGYVAGSPKRNFIPSPGTGCTKYCECLNTNRWKEMPCETGTHWNQDLEVCDHAVNVQCSVVEVLEDNSPIAKQEGDGVVFDIDAFMQKYGLEYLNSPAYAGNKDGDILKKLVESVNNQTSTQALTKATTLSTTTKEGVVIIDVYPPPSVPTSRLTSPLNKKRTPKSRNANTATTTITSTLATTTEEPTTPNDLAELRAHYNRMIEKNDWHRKRARQAGILKLVEQLRQTAERNAEKTKHSDTNEDDTENITEKNNDSKTDDNDNDSDDDEGENAETKQPKMKHVEINLPWKSNEISESADDDSIYKDKAVWIGVACGIGFSTVVCLLCCCFYRALLHLKLGRDEDGIRNISLCSLAATTDKPKDDNPVYVRLSQAKNDKNGNHYVVSIMDEKKKDDESGWSSEEEVFNVSAVNNENSSRTSIGASTSTPNVTPIKMKRKIP